MGMELREALNSLSVNMKIVVCDVNMCGGFHRHRVGASTHGSDPGSDQRYSDQYKSARMN